MSMLLRRHMMRKAGGDWRDLYQQVEYLESTGTQCIDTGVIPTTNTNILLKKGATSGTLYNFYFGACSGLDQYGVSASFFCFYNKTNVSVPNNAQNTACTLEITDGVLSIDGVEMVDSSGESNTSTRNMVLFARTGTRTGAYERFSSMKVYAFKMWEETTPVRDLVPCIRISDSKPGMYDLVGRTFYTNAGTGEFVVGPEVFGGWTKTVYTATADTLRGDTTTGAMLASIPSGFRYAVAIADDISSPESNAFIGCVFLPGTTKISGFRWSSGSFATVFEMESSRRDVILRTGQTVSIWWRSEPLSDDVPPSTWNYRCLEPGVMANAEQVKNALLSVGAFGAMLSVSDMDFNTPPTTNNAYCDSVIANSQSPSMTYIRYRDGSYVNGGVSASYDLVTESTTKIACFYI